MSTELQTRCGPSGCSPAQGPHHRLTCAARGGAADFARSRRAARSRARCSAPCPPGAAGPEAPPGSSRRTERGVGMPHPVSPRLPRERQERAHVGRDLGDLLLENRVVRRHEPGRGTRRAQSDTPSRRGGAQEQTSPPVTTMAARRPPSFAGEVAYPGCPAVEGVRAGPDAAARRSAGRLDDHRRPAASVIPPGYPVQEVPRARLPPAPGDHIARTAARR